MPEHLPISDPERTETPPLGEPRLREPRSRGWRLGGAIPVLVAALLIPAIAPLRAAASPPEKEWDEPLPPGEEARYDEYPEAPLRLDEDEVDAIADGLKLRCGLSRTVAREEAPWYFHYELGLEMMARGDLQRALDSLVAATHRRGDQSLSVRLYGMWFRDYLPYFYIARLHAILGNTDCARDALARALAGGSIRDRPELTRELEALISELEPATSDS